MLLFSFEILKITFAYFLKHFHTQKYKKNNVSESLMAI